MKGQMWKISSPTEAMVDLMEHKYVVSPELAGLLFLSDFCSLIKSQETGKMILLACYFSPTSK